MCLRASFRYRAGEEHRRRPRVIRSGRYVGATRAGDVRMGEPADHVDALPERLERFENFGELEAAPVVDGVHLSIVAPCGT